ncbi:ubiquitin like 3 [Phyllostomus discolor]|uniref:Ubiquitin-like protein n=1 Tax=Phyllostomus discolor TaxID=89673 RepID=A0A834EML9_9CHIR|nr:ubiquitin like 3 [Phyllostomus discolor]
MSSNVPADMINLRLILVSGKTKEFLFSPNDSASDIAKHVYDNWPMDWEEEQVSSPNILRLIYQGRFLHGNVTLGALKLPFGKTTVMHLVARETLPEPNSQETQHCFRNLRKSACKAMELNAHMNTVIFS